MYRNNKWLNFIFNIFVPKNDSATPTTQVQFSEVEHCDIGGFSARKSSTPISTYQLKGSVTSSLGPKKRFISAQGSRIISSEPRARWAKLAPTGVKRPSHQIVETVDLESNDEIIVLDPPSKKAKMESRENSNGLFSNDEKDVEIVKVIDGKKARSIIGQYRVPWTYSTFKRRIFKRSTVMWEGEKEDRRKYSDLLQSHVYTAVNREKPIESAGLKTRLALEVINKSLTADQKISGNAPVVIDLVEEKKEEAVQNRVQVNRRRSVTPVTQATEKPHVPERRSMADVYSSKFLSRIPRHDFVYNDKFSKWREEHIKSQKAKQEQIKSMEKESELLRQRNFAVMKKKEQEVVDSLSKQVKDYIYLTECHPVVEEVEEIPPIPKLTEEMESEVDNALRGSPSEVLAEAFSLKILRRDIQTLKGLNWLNDEIINFYMNLIMDRGKQEKYPSVYAFNTFFYPKLISGGHSALKRWTKKVDIFSYDFVLAPVHLGVHWCMAIIDMREKSIKYFDSMGGRNEQCLKALKQYLCDEMMDKKKEKLDLTDWEFVCMEDIPQQQNGSDCGMFSCKFAEYITRRAPIIFTQSDMPNFRKLMIYEIIKVKLLC